MVSCGRLQAETEYPKVEGYLIDTCLSAQDNYKEMIRSFFPETGKEELKL